MIDMTSSMGQTPSRRSAILVRSTGGVSKLVAQGPPPFASVPWQIAQLSAKSAFPASRDTSGVVDGAHPNRRRPNEIKLYFMMYPIIAKLLLWRGTSSLLRFSRYTKTDPFWLCNQQSCNEKRACNPATGHHDFSMFHSWSLARMSDKLQYRLGSRRSSSILGVASPRQSMSASGSPQCRN